MVKVWEILIRIFFNSSFLTILIFKSYSDDYK
jgi:hypothetical protein